MDIIASLIRIGYLACATIEIDYKYDIIGCVVVLTCTVVDMQSIQCCGSKYTVYVFWVNFQLF